MSTMALVRRSTSSLTKTSTKTSSLTKQSSRETKSDEEDGSSRSAIQLECDQVYQGIKKWKAHEGAVLLPIVRKETIEPLRNRAKPRWWKVKKGM